MVEAGTPTAKPFTFNRSFDLATLKTEQEKKVAPTFGEAELALAREQAYAAGVVAGKESALREIQHQQMVLLNHIKELCENFAGKIWEAHHEQKQAATDIAITIARKIVPDYVRKNGLQEIMAQVEPCVAEMINEPRLVLRIHDKHFDFISQEITALTQRLAYGGKIIILADEGLGDDDCRLEWADGGMERSVSLTWSEIEKQLMRHQAENTPHTAAHTPSPFTPSPFPASGQTDIAV